MWLASGRRLIEPFAERQHTPLWIIRPVAADSSPSAHSDLHAYQFATGAFTV